jgi:hypothetical protein
VLRTGGNWSMLSNHAEFTMFAFLPFYALHQNAETLLVLQAVALGSGAIPIYRFAARRIPRSMAWMLAFAYLFYAPMHQANFYDVHFQPFGAVFTLWALDFLDLRRFWFCFRCSSCWPSAAAKTSPSGSSWSGSTSSWPDSVRGWAPSVRPVGRLLRRHQVRRHAALRAVVVQRHVQGALPNGREFLCRRDEDLHHQSVYVFKTLITTEKMTFFLQTTAPLAFLPLRRRLLWLSLLPGRLVHLADHGYSPTVEISFQYVCYNIPFLFLAAAIALGHDGAGQGGAD